MRVLRSLLDTILGLRSPNLGWTTRGNAVAVTDTTSVCCTTSRDATEAADNCPECAAKASRLEAQRPIWCSRQPETNEAAGENSWDASPGGLESTMGTNQHAVRV